MDAARRATLAVVAGVVCLGSPGCVVVSLFPLYENGKLEALPALVGSWKNEEDRVTLDIEAAGWSCYAATWREAAGRYGGRVCLTRVAGELFADVSVPPGEERGPLLVVVHGWCRVKVAGDTLSVEALDYDRLSSPGRRRSLPGARLDERGNLLLTAGTASLRNWLARNAGREGVLAPAVEFSRAAPSRAGAASPALQRHARRWCGRAGCEGHGRAAAAGLPRP